MLTYNECPAVLKNRPTKKLANNTYLKKQPDDCYAVRLHNTDILLFKPDGSVVYNSGGWKTVTTKDRMNRFGPVNITQVGSRWLVQHGLVYQDGMRVLADGTIEGALPDRAAAWKKWRPRIVRFAKAYVEKLLKGEISEPGGGDCWYCLMQVVDGPDKGKSLGEASRNPDHLWAHVQEEYYVPSLIMRAIKRFPVSIYARGVLSDLWDAPIATAREELLRLQQRGDDVARHQLTSSLRRYLLEQMANSEPPADEVPNASTGE